MSAAYFPPPCTDSTCTRVHRAKVDEGHLHEGQLYTQIVECTQSKTGKLNLRVKSHYYFDPYISAELVRCLPRWADIESAVTSKRAAKLLAETIEVHSETRFLNEDQNDLTKPSIEAVINQKVFTTLQGLKGIK